MSVYMTAPYDTPRTTIRLPSPTFSDEQGHYQDVDVKVAMSGDLFTTVRTSRKRKVTWEFNLTRMKSLEFEAFLALYTGNRIKIFDWDTGVYKAHFITNPVEFVPNGKDNVRVKIEFVGEKLQ